MKVDPAPRQSYLNQMNNEEDNIRVCEVEVKSRAKCE